MRTLVITAIFGRLEWPGAGFTLEKGANLVPEWRFNALPEHVRSKLAMYEAKHIVRIKRPQDPEPPRAA